MNQKTQTKATHNQNPSKICKNTACKKRFYKRPTETNVQWGLRKYCSRACQTTYSNRKRRRGPPNLTSVKLWDACNNYMIGAQERLTDQVTFYDSKSMSQEELRRLIPSEH